MCIDTKRKILIVDDDERWLKKISRILQADYELTLITEPSEAFNALKEHVYSLVILDMKFPAGVSGLDVFSQMQDISPNLHAIILTGYPNTSSMQSSFKRGFLDYLEKGSINLSQELKTVVEEVLAKSEAYEIMNLIAQGESEELEFKSTVRWDMRANKINKELEKVIIKTIATFFNSGTGGILLVGVDDDGKILGLANDYKTLGDRQNKDGFENLLMTLLLDACGKECIALVKIVFHQIEGQEVCQINIKSSPKPIFVKEDKNEHLYIRTGNSIRLLAAREAIEYCKIHWKN